jgi:hypothetical protein
MRHTEVGWRSGGGLCWRTTRQGIANWRLIHSDGRRHGARDRASIAWIDLRMPRKTHGSCRREAASSLSWLHLIDPHNICLRLLSSVHQLLYDLLPPHPDTALQGTQLPIRKVTIAAGLQSL